MNDSGVPAKLEKPVVEAGAWVAPGAVLVGKVVVRRGASVWYGCVLRSDMEGAEIEIGEDDAMIAMGATVLNGARVGRGSIVAAGAVVPHKWGT